MKSLYRVSIALVLISTAVACGQWTNPTEKKTISTDLPDDKDSDGTVKMYWVDKGVIFRGDCGDAYVIIENCQNDIEKMPYVDFKTKLDNGVTASVVDLVKKLDEIEAMIDSLDGERKTTVEAIKVYEASLGQASSDLNDAKAELAEVERLIGGYKSQLAAIKARLKSRPDADLLAQSKEMAAELQTLLDDCAKLSSAMPALVNRVKFFSTVVSALYEHFDTLSGKIDALSKEHAKTALALQAAIDDLASYQQTLAMLTDDQGINYRVHADSAWFTKVRRFVKRFDAIFG